MSWQDDLNNKIFTIITGDNKLYFPKWRNASKEIEFNYSIFEFVEVDGSLVLRKKPKGRKFDLEFFFDGEDAVSKGNEFEESARNKERNWTVKHPFYGNIICQPISLKQDNSSLNVSKFNVLVIETIKDIYPETTRILEDEIQGQMIILEDAQVIAYSKSKELDKVSLQQTTSRLDTVLSKIIKADEDYKAFKSKVSDAVDEINNTLSTGTSILREIYEIIHFPATIIQTVEARFNVFKEALDNIIELFDGNKNQFEAIGGGLISSMFLTSISETDYKTKSDVIKQQDLLLEQYNRYLSFLDNLQTERADNNNSYTPDFAAIQALDRLSKLTIANLFEIAFELKQEREFILDKDSNPIVLTHRFYGMDKNDENLEYFISTNNIGINEILNLKKGRKVVYYV